MHIVHSSDDTLSHLEYYITTVHHQLRIPGLAVAIVQDHEIVYQRGLGEAAPGRTTTPSTPFILGSLSKSFTALAIMQLVEAGKLDLDAPVQRYIPWFRVSGHAGSASSDNRSAQITVRHLLCHISGLPRYEGRNLLSGPGGKTLEQVVRELRSVKLIKPIGITELVGSTFQYSNLNYAVLGYLIEVVSGQSYGDYIQQHIFEPLDMHNSSTNERKAIQLGLAQGYRWWFGWPMPFTAPYLQEAVPAAFLTSSIEDMAKYLIACLDAGTSDGALLSRKGFEEMYAPQGLMKRRDNFNYGFGWRTGMYAGEEMLRHGGEVSNFRADMVLLPGRKLGVVVLVNSNNGLIAQLGLDQIALNVVRLLLGQPLPKKTLTFRRFYVLVDLLVVAISLIQVGSLVQLLRSPSRRPVPIGSFLAMFGDVIGPVVLLWRLPKWADMPWRGLVLYVPDMSRWSVGMAMISLVKIGVRLYRWLRE